MDVARNNFDEEISLPLGGLVLFAHCCVICSRPFWRAMVLMQPTSCRSTAHFVECVAFMHLSYPTVR